MRQRERRWNGVVPGACAFAVAGTLLAIAACASSGDDYEAAATKGSSSTPNAGQPQAKGHNAHAATIGAVTIVDLPVSANAPVAKTDAHAKEHALHNIHPLGKKMISGGVPDGDAAFDELREMGVKTIISVDGVTPDVKRAQARGMRYVHVPITYAEVSPEQQLEIARAVRDLPGPIYIHCHHGKHRSPAATAAVAVALGEVTPEEGVAFMKNAGTSAHYTGLYSCVASAVTLSAAALDDAPAEFPSVRAPEGIVGAMVEVDHAYEQLGYIRAAGWTVPKDHPDLVPVSEAGRLTDQMRFCKDDPKTRSYKDVADFDAKLAAAIVSASELEERIVKGAPKADLEASWAKVAASCKDCHTSHRDHR